MLPLCADQGSVWSLGARWPGRLTRLGHGTARSETDEFGKRLYRDSEPPHRRGGGEVAEPVPLSRAQVALAWLLSKTGREPPIVGVTRSAQLADSWEHLSVELSAEEVSSLEEPYEPHPVAGH